MLEVSFLKYLPIFTCCLLCLEFPFYKPSAPKRISSASTPEMKSADNAILIRVTPSKPTDVNRFRTVKLCLGMHCWIIQTLLLFSLFLPFLCCFALLLPLWALYCTIPGTRTVFCLCYSVKCLMALDNNITLTASKLLSSQDFLI